MADRIWRRFSPKRPLAPIHEYDRADGPFFRRPVPGRLTRTGRTRYAVARRGTRPALAPRDAASVDAAGCDQSCPLRVGAADFPREERPMRHLLGSLILAAMTAAAPSDASAQSGQAAQKWVTSWAASVQGPYPVGNPSAQPDQRFAFPSPETGARDQTFRLIVRPDL